MAHVAILQTAFLGDTLLSIPLAKMLALKGHRLTLICRKGYRGLLDATGLFENVIEIEKGNSDSYKDAQEQLNVWWASAERKVFVSPHESPRSKMFALGLRMNGVATIGYRDRGFFVGPSVVAYTDRVLRPMELPEVMRQLALLQCAAISGEAEAAIWKSRIHEFSSRQELAGGRMKSGELMSVPEWASMKIDRSELREPVAVLSPGSVWRTKQWTESGFIEVGRRFRELGKKVILTGTKEEAELCERIAIGIGEGARSMAGQISLLETAHEMARAEIAVVNDSGGMHLASMADTPVVAIYGPTILNFGYRPWSNKARVVEPGPLECRPCGLHGSQSCPIGTHICMKDTNADKVWQEVQSLLAPPVL